MSQSLRGTARFWPLAATAAIGLNLFLTWRFQSVGSAAAAANRLVDSVSTEARVLQSERRGLMALLRQIDLSASPLRGSVIHSDGLRDSTIEQARLVYTIAPQCPVCALNLPFLNQISSENPGSVIGVSSAPADETLRYVTANRVAFPVLVNPVGGAMKVLPRHATPVLLIIAEARLAALFSGRLNATEQSFVRTAAGQLTGTAPEGHLVKEVSQ